MNEPWKYEPDSKQWNCEGYRCEMIRHAELKHWCGYVDLPKGHPLFGKGYDDKIVPPAHIMERPVSIDKIGAITLLCSSIGKGGEVNLGVCFDVHGGLTFARERNGLWRFGFDCAHSGDFAPYRGAGPREGEVYRDEAFVTAETESLARQLKAVEHWWDHCL